MSSIVNWLFLYLVNRLIREPVIFLLSGNIVILGSLKFVISVIKFYLLFLISTIPKIKVTVIVNFCFFTSLVTVKPLNFVLNIPN